jgi:hypothetical protein
MIIDLRLASMRMDSVLNHSCAINFFRGTIWSHLFVNLIMQSLVLLVLFFLVRFFTWLFTAAQVALLTIYDMCKAVDRGMVMGDVKLLDKSGSKSGTWVAAK